MLYCCETCGEKFISEEKALECEQIHREEKARQEELAKEKETRTRAIEKSIMNLDKDIEKFYEDYCTHPNISVTLGRNPFMESVLQWLFR